MKPIASVHTYLREVILFFLLGAKVFKKNTYDELLCSVFNLILYKIKYALVLPTHTPPKN